jgi:hypothetical protein
MSLLFGMRQEVYLLAPIHNDSNRVGPAGVALLASELYGDVEKFLIDTMPNKLFQPKPLSRLDKLIRDSVKRPLAPGCEPNLQVFYRALEDYRPYLGPWIELIERLDESTDTDPHALALLARHSGGVFVVRHHGSIIAYTGLRAYSPFVWELTPPRLTASAHAHRVKRTDELFSALIACATRAAIKEGHIPLCTISPREAKLRNALVASGYRHYANASAYATIIH